MRIVLVSNRLPFTFSLRDGKPHFEPSAGGLTTGLWSFVQKRCEKAGCGTEFIWAGWPGFPVEPEQQQAVREFALSNFKAVPVFLPNENFSPFYDGFCNKTLWPLFHYFPSVARYDLKYWQEYKRVNRFYAEALLEFLQPDDVVWIHDYQLMLLPQMLRERFPSLSIGFFLHIPFPSFEVFRLLPAVCRTEIIEGLLGSSLIGFHTHDYTRHFLGCVLRTCGYEHHLGTLTLRDRVVKVDTFPMGIDFERFAHAAATSETQESASKLQQSCKGQKIIFSLDRLDYTKGLLERLRGYELFLRQNPQWREKVVFILCVSPSRSSVDSYRTMRRELEQTVGRIVGAHGTVQWTPLVYQYRTLGFEEVVAMYRACDIALITPLRDGMNLVAKEFVASRSDQTGVLVLSEMAGAAKEMGEAIIINPYQEEDFARGLEQALSLTREEQVRRNQALQERLRRYDVSRWADDFLQSLAATQKTEEIRAARWLTGRAQGGLVQQYQSASKAAIILDYDGTLVPFSDRPQLAKPDDDLLKLLASLASEPRTEVAIVSGRPRRTLEEWFGHLPISLVAEHGSWVRSCGAEWNCRKAGTQDWKDKLKPILQLYVDRLPGALLEEKEFSLAWHFRRADPEQASIRAAELRDDLADYTRNIDVQVLEGNKVLEVRNTGVTKGSAALEWISGFSPEFILAMGDDWTDEDLFRALPRNAYTIKIGLGSTAARYYLGTHTAVRHLLRVLLESRRKTSVGCVGRAQDFCLNAAADAADPRARATPPESESQEATTT